MLVFLDDYRDPPTGDWKVVRNIDEFQQVVRNYLPEIEHIAFDHDLADAHYGGDMSDERTGYDCAKFLVDECDARDLPLPGFSCHSLNPAGKANILGYLEGYKVHRGAK